MTSIFKRKSSPYYYIKIKLPNGKWVMKSTGTKDKKLAKRILLKKEWEAWDRSIDTTKDYVSVIKNLFKNIQQVKVENKTRNRIENINKEDIPTVEKKDEEIKRLNRTIATSFNVIKKLKRKYENKLGELSGEEFENMVEPHRFKNGRLNMTKAGKALNVSKDTIRREIERRKIMHIIDQPKND